MSIINFTVEYDALSSLTDSADIGADADVVPLVGTVTFTPVFNDNKQVLAPGYSPRPACFTIRNFVGVVDTDGRLKASKGGAVGVRLWANDPVLELETLTYRCDFNLSTTLGEKVTVESGYFEAPSDDSTINLADVLVPTGSPSVSNLDQIELFAHEIKDSSEIGVAVMTATDPATARLALAPAVFDARDYGVIADGQPHNNVANLLDCVAQCEQAGGGTVLLPAGVIDTSDADLGTVVSNSGNIYTNVGGITVPHDTAITFTGQGVGATVLRLSAGFQRAFDFVRIAGSLSTPQTISNVTIRNMTVDRDNLAGTDVATQTISLASPITIAAGASAAIPGLSAATFGNANFIYVESVQKALAISISGSTITATNPTSSSVTIASGSQTITAGIYGHVLAGTRVQGWSGTYGTALQISDVLIEDVHVINAPTTQMANVSISPRDWPFGVGFNVNSTSSVQSQVTNLRCNRVRIDGCQYGFEVVGNKGSWLDEIWFTDCYHDTGTVPTHYTAATNFFVGQDAWVGTTGVVRCEGHNAWDVAWEIDQPWTAWEVDCSWTTANNACYRTTFTPPARTADGPPTATIAAGLGSSATTCSINSLPSDVDREGLAEIADPNNASARELVWYRATNTAGTALKLWRGMNGTTALTHPSNAAVTFIQTDRTRVHSIRSKIIQAENLSTSFGTCWSAYENYGYPIPPLTLRDGLATIIGGDNYSGRVIRTEGWCPEIDIEGLRATQTGYSGSNAIGQGASSAIYQWSGFTAAMYLLGNTLPLSQATKDTLAATRVPCPPPIIRGRNNKLVIAGAANTSYSYHGLYLKEGFIQFDLDLEVEFGVANASSNVAVILDGGVVADSSQMKVTIANRAEQITAGPVVGLSAGSSSYLTIAAPITVSVDASRLSFTADGNDSNYYPWSIDGSQAGNVIIDKVSHARGVSKKYVTTPAIYGSTGEHIAAWQTVGRSAVNYLAVGNGLTESSPFISVRESGDSNVGLAFLTKGSGNITIYSQTGNHATILSSGEDNDRNLNLRGSGSGKINIGNNNSGDGQGTLVTGTVELGGATDTTLARASAGIVSVEGVAIPTVSSTHALTNKDLSSSTNAFPTTLKIASIQDTGAIERININSGGKVTINGAPAIPGSWHPDAFGNNSMIAWAYDPVLAFSTYDAFSANGYLILTGVWIPHPCTITNVMYCVDTADTGLTSNNCFAGLYQGGSLKATTGTIHSTFSSAGYKTIPLSTSATVTAGLAYVGFYVNGATTLKMAMCFTNGKSWSVSGYTGSNPRFAYADSGLTTALPSTLGTRNQFGWNPVWAAVS